MTRRSSLLDHLDRLEARLARIEGKGGLLYSTDDLASAMELSGLRVCPEMMPDAVARLYAGRGDVHAAWVRAGYPWPCVITDNPADLDL